MSGKGSKPRNCFSSDFRENFDEINWSGKPKTEFMFNASNTLFLEKLSAEILDLCYLIEKIPASKQQTTASLAASSLKILVETRVKNELDYMRNISDELNDCTPEVDKNTATLKNASEAQKIVAELFKQPDLL